MNSSDPRFIFFCESRGANRIFFCSRSFKRIFCAASCELAFSIEYSVQKAIDFIVLTILEISSRVAIGGVCAFFRKNGMSSSGNSSVSIV